MDLGKLLGMFGSAAGTAVGGPLGMALGGQLGSGLGSFITDPSSGEGGQRRQLVRDAEEPDLSILKGLLGGLL